MKKETIIKYYKYALLLLFPMIPISIIWDLMSPITFWERFAMLTLSSIEYFIIFGIEFNSIINLSE